MVFHLASPPEANERADDSSTRLGDEQRRVRRTQVRSYRLESVNDPGYRTRQSILREVNPAPHKSPQGEEKLATENGAPGDVATWSARERSVVNLGARKIEFAFEILYISMSAEDLDQRNINQG